MSSVISYESRVARIKSIQDLDKQLRNAKAYSARLRTAALAASTLDEKLKLHAVKKQADSVLHQLRCNYFALEDEIKAAAMVP